MHAPRLSCRRAAPRLTTYLTGGLPAEEAAMIRRHLEVCEACRASAKSLADTLDLLRDALAASAASVPGFEPARVERLRVETARPPAVASARTFRLNPVWAAAAALVAMLGVAMVFPMVKGGIERREILGAAAKARSIMQAVYSKDTEGIYLEVVAWPQKAQPATPCANPFFRVRGEPAGQGQVGAKLAATTITAPAPAASAPPGELAEGPRDRYRADNNRDSIASARPDSTLAFHYEGATAVSAGALESETLKNMGHGTLSLAAGESGGGGIRFADADGDGYVDRSGQGGAAEEAARRSQVQEGPLVMRGYYATRSGAGRAGAREREKTLDSTVAYDDVGKAIGDDKEAKKDEDGRRVAADGKEKQRDQVDRGLGWSGADQLQIGGNKTESGKAPLVGDIPAIGALSGSDAYSERTVLPPETPKPGSRTVADFSFTTPAALAGQLRALDADGLKALLESHGASFPDGATLNFESEFGRLNVGHTTSEASDSVRRALDALSPADVEFNAYVPTATNASSTFSIDVDTASYALVRRELLAGRRPRPDEVRTEEIVNALDYGYRSPPAGEDFAVETRLAASPFRPSQTVLQLGVTARRVGRDRRRPAALTAVLDLSGSMNTPDRLGRARRALAMLADALGPDDTLALVVFGSDARLALEPTPAADPARIRAALAALATAGSTHLENGLRLGYATAARHFRAGASNRVLLFSDGVANLGADTAAELLAGVAAERARGVTLSVFGVGAGSFNDALLEQLADRGDGAYTILDSDDAARRALVDDLTATLHVVARDVKIQVEFNPARAVRWRQLGYENRRLTRAQFRDDRTDAGEVGSGQSVTALYELDGLAPPPSGATAADAALATVRLRWRDEGGRIRETETRIPAPATPPDFASAPATTRLAVCAAEFAERLRGSPYSAGLAPRGIVDALQPAALELGRDRRVEEFAELVRRAADLRPGTGAP